MPADCCPVFVASSLLWSDQNFPGLINAAIAIAITITCLPHCVRITRASVIAESSKDYVTASRLSGAGVLRLVFITILPNCMAPLIVQASFGFSNAILDAAALGFIGLGARRRARSSAIFPYQAAPSFSTGIRSKDFMGKRGRFC